ncbi:MULTISPECIES: SRPBCC family protein [Photobacterium]|uniref:Ribosome association toxin RatA n=1 Tax=Photobacterium ganghwense TaxID=320778 RepID=A0A0J1JZK8_9GAMM|nr:MULTISPECIES: SRPBCC family protein [Photobacterium]KLV07667.1 cyclase [Photobacterium ganghwense]MBV1840772.1 ubiquinone-binding protein [Photobacterium ganghwense]PSU11480.1 ubiquinone-binding protein [Photobacterium ganghwense]QSV13588.1 ubiquinone-binding protein [Photobacterium ganghwense]
MPQISRSALVPFSAKQMFELVNDVESYPAFLPGCSGTKIIESSELHMMAAVDVSKAGIKKTFVTRNALTAGSKIDMQLVDGPFRRLVGGWHFIELDADACKVELKLDFEFTNALVEAAFGKVFKELTGNMISAFTQRAREVYGF